ERGPAPVKLERVSTIESLSKGSYQGRRYLTPVILSEAPERFISYQDHWRVVEGSRECVPYRAVSGSSQENAIAARRRLGGFFLRDRSWLLHLDAFHSRKMKPKRSFQGLAPLLGCLREPGTSGDSGAVNHVEQRRKARQEGSPGRKPAGVSRKM